MNYRRGWLVVASLVVVLVGAASAEECTHHCEGECAQDSAMTAGKWALQFGIGNNFTLTNFDGGMLSVKRTLSPRSALRLGVDINARTTDRDYDNTGGVREEFRDESSDDYSADVSLLYLRYLHPRGNVRIFAGAGPEIGYLREKDSWFRSASQSNPDTSWTDIRSSSRDGWSAGLRLALGAEWFVHTSFSLHAESGLVARYRDEEYKTKNEHNLTSSRTTMSSFEVNATTVRFGLSIYF